MTNVREAVQWLSYTYLYIRMMKNPLSYGVPHQEKVFFSLFSVVILRLCTPLFVVVQHVWAVFSLPPLPPPLFFLQS